MTKFNLDSDFELLVDNLESVTLRSRATSNETFVAAAFREQAVTEEMQPGGGLAIRAEAVWHLQLPKQGAAPQIGDAIIDQQQNRWTILAMQQLVALGRCKCTTRELRLAFGCHQRVDVQRPVWGDNGSGPEVVAWADVCAALPVSIRLDELILDTSTTPPTKQLIYEIVLSESIELEPDDRLIDEQGQSYRLQSLQGADRIDTLPIAKAALEETT